MLAHVTEASALSDPFRRTWQRTNAVDAASELELCADMSTLELQMVRARATLSHKRLPPLVWVNFCCRVDVAERLQAC